MISVPGVRQSRRKPRRRRTFGVPPSTIHTSVVPSSLVCSRWIHVCGFTHSSFTIGPASLIGASRSNSAPNAWWPSTGQRASVGLALEHSSGRPGPGGGRIRDAWEDLQGDDGRDAGVAALKNKSHLIKSKEITKLNNDYKLTQAINAGLIEQYDRQAEQQRQLRTKMNQFIKNVYICI